MRYLIFLVLALADLQSFGQANVMERFIRIYYQRSAFDGKVNIKIDNLLPAPVYFKFSLSLSNMVSEEGEEFAVLVPARTLAKTVTVLTQDAKDMAYKYSYRYMMSMGDPLLHTDDYGYGAPCATDKGFKIIQGPNGSFSHQDSYAIDINTPEGTPVYASRDGVVAMIKDDSNKGGPSTDFASEGNFISVYHSDGTVANYYHLKQNGAAVKQGDKVSRGALLGYSGNTGFSAGPHLHFDLSKPDRYTAKTLKVPFCLYTDKKICDFVKGQLLQ